MRNIFHELHIRFLAHLMASNHGDAFPANTITLQGRQKLRELQRGYSTYGPEERGVNSHTAEQPEANSLVDRKSLRGTLILTLQSAIQTSRWELRTISDLRRIATARLDVDDFV
jgi:hypothetical protein